MDDDGQIGFVKSSRSCTATIKGKTVDIQILQFEGDDSWSLKLCWENRAGDDLAWRNRFDSEAGAYDAACLFIRMSEHAEPRPHRRDQQPTGTLTGKSTWDADKSSGKNADPAGVIVSPLSFQEVIEGETVRMRIFRQRLDRRWSLEINSASLQHCRFRRFSSDTSAYEAVCMFLDMARAESDQSPVQGKTNTTGPLTAGNRKLH